MRLDQLQLIQHLRITSPVFFEKEILSCFKLDILTKLFPFYSPFKHIDLKWRNNTLHL